MILAEQTFYHKPDSFTFDAIPQIQELPDDDSASILVIDNQASILDRSKPPEPFENASFSPPAPDAVDAPYQPRVLDYSWQPPLIRQMTEWLRVFVQEDQVVELRALNVEMRNGAKVTYSGFYNFEGLDQMAADALDLSGSAEGVYFTLNPLDKSLLARRYNKAAPAKDTASDADVLVRHWLLVDADPARKSGISSTKEEKQRAWETICKVLRWLKSQGWADSVVADSGNGYHLLYRIDLECQDDGLVRSVLEALAARFDTGKVKIDTKVFNPSRIVKLYGTIARKGESIRERPHRRTGILLVPKEQVVVSREQLAAILPDKPNQQLPAAPAPASNHLLIGASADRFQRARNYLKKVPPAISGESGHNQTFKTACLLLRLFGLTVEEAWPLFQEWNETCQPPWSEKDLSKKLQDAARHIFVGAGSVAPIPQVRSTETGQDAIQSPDPAALPEAREAADDPHRLAKLFLQNAGQEKGQMIIRFWNGDWYKWNTGAYHQVPEEEMRASVTRTIKEEFNRLNLLERLGLGNPELDKQPDREPNARKVTTALVGNTLLALRSLTIVPSNIELPAWLEEDGQFPTNEVLVAKNGIVHLPSLVQGKDFLQPLSPSFFTTVALDYEIDRDAKQPAAWLQFLNELWPDDQESISLLQEWFGYCLTPETSQQKMLLVIGPKRGGKGTIARVLRALVGSVNVAGPTLGSLAGNFGLSSLLGKPVAIISDARFSGRSSEQAIVVERLLSISGEDMLTIDRKNREHVSVKLPTRFTILTNELPRLTDASAALPSRLLVLQLTRSWYDQEDTELASRLLEEREGIFLWSIEGLKRLRARRRFVQPASGVETARRMIELSSPVTAFVQDCCEFQQGKSVAKRTLFEVWRSWCTDSGHEPGNVATFGRNLMAAFPEVQSSRPREGGSRVTSYSGIGLRRLQG